ncbi:MAG: alpha/beta hydrolase [Clostridia bacterium]|nr:alpha/beta hydrolase [Clostridia bacterium]
MITKKTIVFLHGYLSNKESFNLNINYLKKYFNCFAFDLTGFGEGKNMDYPYSLDDYIKEVKEKLKENNIKKPHIIAHSFGARIALKLASQNKNFFDKMVITGGAGLKPKKTLKKVIKRWLFKFLKIFLPKERLKGFYSKDYNSLSPVMQKSFVKIVNEHLDGRLSKIENKTLLIYGSLDKETPLYMAKRFNKNIKNSSLFVIKGAGHFCFVEKPDLFNFTVKEFLLKK